MKDRQAQYLALTSSGILAVSSCESTPFDIEFLVREMSWQVHL